MRISAIPGDDDYHPIVSKEDCFNVFLDGVNVSKKYLMFTVDEQEGYIDYYVTDDKGSIVIEDNQVSTNRLHGDVLIKFKK